MVVLFCHYHQHPNTVNTSIQTLDHQIFSKGQWKNAIITTHPQVTLNLALDKHPFKSWGSVLLMMQELNHAYGC